MKNSLLVFLLLFVSTVGFAQKGKKNEVLTKNSIKTATKSNSIKTIDWTPTIEISMPNGEKNRYLNFTGASFDVSPDRLPTVFITKELQKDESDAEIALLNTTFETLSAEEIKGVDGLQKLTENIALTKNVGYHRGQPILSISFTPVRRLSNGSFEKLVSYELNVVPKKNGNKTNSVARTYSPSSVLSSGDWYKIAITRDGVYKLDYEFLKKTGIDIKLVNPRTIRLFGNGGGMLPFSNSAPRVDDLSIYFQSSSKYALQIYANT